MAAVVDRGLPHIMSMDRLTSASHFQLGRSIQSGYHQSRLNVGRPETDAGAYTIKTAEGVFSSFPEKKPKTAKEKKAEEEKKKKLAEEEAILKALPRYEENESALMGADSWQNSVSIAKKYAVGTLASSKYGEQVKTFSKVHEAIEEESNILPLSSYFGPHPDPEKDRFNRRMVQQLNDIDFSEDSEDDFEDVVAIKRQNRTTLTEENLRKYLSQETTKLNIEHHYWLKDSFLSKIGKMAPNLVELCLRRLKISNQSFAEMSRHLKVVQKLDISECQLIESSGLKSFLDTCGETVVELQASNC